MTNKGTATQVNENAPGVSPAEENANRLIVFNCVEEVLAVLRSAPSGISQEGAIGSCHSDPWLAAVVLRILEATGYASRDDDGSYRLVTRKRSLSASARV